MGGLVLYQITFLRKALTTFNALKRLLNRVRMQVSSQIFFLNKMFITLTADIRLLTPRVDQQVRFQVASLPKYF